MKVKPTVLRRFVFCLGPSLVSALSTSLQQGTLHLLRTRGGYMKARTALDEVDGKGNFLRTDAGFRDTCVNAMVFSTALLPIRCFDQRASAAFVCVAHT